MAAIEAAGLRKAFGSVQALDGLDLEVPDGSVCGLLGPNGAGKTTAVRVLATLTRPDAGTASVGGHDVVRYPQRVRSVIGLAGQHAAVDEDLTGRENLFILGLMHHLGRRRRPGYGPPSCWTSSAWPTPPTGWSRPGRAACGDGSTWSPA